VYVDSVCSKCLQCFFVTDGATTRPPQQQAAPGQHPASSPPFPGQAPHAAAQGHPCARLPTPNARAPPAGVRLGDGEGVEGVGGLMRTADVLLPLLWDALLS
jgi:hypothetical protein